MKRWTFTKVLFMWWLALMIGNESERSSAAKAIAAEADVCEQNVRRHLAAVEADIAARKAAGL